MNENQRKKITLVVVSIFIAVLSGFGFYNINKDKTTDEIVDSAINEVVNQLSTYEMSETDIEQLPTTEIIEQTEEQENAQEQEVEDEAFELQGEIAYNGTSEYPNVVLGDYTGLTYYSQIDSRWSSHPYTSCGNYSQTIGSSGCGPTCASMVVTATRGTITPPDMGDLFVKYGYRTSNNGTYFSAFRFVADTFDIGYEETYYLDTAVNLLRNNHYVIVSCGNGLFTTGGHFIVLTGINGDTLEIYDPYLYSGKFETSTRRGKVSVNGNTVYCSVDNFRNYANYSKFFAFSHSGNVQVNNSQPVTTSTYTRYVNAKIGLNVRNKANGYRIGGLANGTRVTVIGTEGNWSHISSPVNGWVSSNYLSSYSQVGNTVSSSNRGYRTGTYKVNASVLNVRYGTGTNYKAKTYRQLSSNARSQNSRLGNYYTNGYKRGVVCTVTRVSGNWGLTASGWICLDYCTKL